jgi:NADH-quinone oxidoreductase subunit J
MFVVWLINLSDVNHKYSDLKIFIHSNMLSNTHMIAGVLYTRYIVAFQTAGVILLVAIVGAISLTSKRKLDIKRQDPNVQIARANTVKLQDVKINSGVTDIDYGV